MSLEHCTVATDQAAGLQNQKTKALSLSFPDLSNRTKPNKKPIEPNRTPIFRLGSAIEQIRTPILL